MNGHAGGTRCASPIIGAGMAGILAAIKLREAGLTDFTVYEKADRVGGTWRENTYPGLACDVPSHLYSYSFAPNPDWSHRFSPGDEIQAYFERVARDATACEPHIRFGDEVVALRVRRRPLAPRDDGRPARRGRRRDRRDRRAPPPELPGHRGTRHASRARCFHSARWDHDVPLDGAPRRRRRHRLDARCRSSRRSSTGSRKLSLFQRTAAVDHAAGEPGLHRRARRRRSGAEPEHLARAARDIGDALRTRSPTRSSTPTRRRCKMIEEACRANLEDERARPGAARAAAPDYRAACKRLVISPDFYDAIQQPNAELVTEGDRARRARRRAHARRPAARARRARARDRLPGRPLHAADGGDRTRRRRARRRRGRSGRPPTCRSRSPASRTSSC